MNQAVSAVHTTQCCWAVMGSATAYAASFVSVTPFDGGADKRAVNIFDYYRHCHFTIHCVWRLSSFSLNLNESINQPIHSWLIIAKPIFDCVQIGFANHRKVISVEAIMSFRCSRQTNGLCQTRDERDPSIFCDVLKLDWTSHNKTDSLTDMHCKSSRNFDLRLHFPKSCNRMRYFCSAF